MFLGNSRNIHIFGNDSVSDALESGGILESPCSSIGDNPVFRVFSPRIIDDTNYDSHSRREV